MVKYTLLSISFQEKIVILVKSYNLIIIPRLIIKYNTPVLSLTVPSSKDVLHINNINKKYVGL
jgi:hypothetical protein